MYAWQPYIVPFYWYMYYVMWEVLKAVGDIEGSVLSASIWMVDVSEISPEVHSKLAS